jgi:hypothetical protein
MGIHGKVHGECEDQRMKPLNYGDWLEKVKMKPSPETLIIWLVYCKVLLTPPLK